MAQAVMATNKTAGALAPRNLHAPTLGQSMSRAVQGAEINWQAKTVTCSNIEIKVAAEKAKEFEAALIPATDEERKEIIGRLSVVQHIEKTMSDDVTQLRAKYAEYHDAWKAVPWDILDWAAKQWRDKNRFFPTPADILALTDQRLQKRRAMHQRLRAIAEFEHTQRFENEGTEEDRRAIIEASLKRVAKAPEENKEQAHE